MALTYSSTIPAILVLIDSAMLCYCLICGIEHSQTHITPDENQDDSGATLQCAPCHGTAYVRVFSGNIFPARQMWMSIRTTNYSNDLYAYFEKYPHAIQELTLTVIGQ